jgi:hypothetical protein
MRAIAPRTGAPEVTLAEEQEQYFPITAGVYRWNDGSVSLLTRWTFTPEERAAITAGEDVYIGQLYFPGANPIAMTPLQVRCGPGEFTIPEQTPG